VRRVSCLHLLAAVLLLGSGAARAQEYDGSSLAALPEAETGIDWSVGLRGSYEANSLTGGRASTALVPEAALAIAGESSRTKLAGGAEFIVDAGGGGRVADLHAGVEQSLRLGPATLLRGALAASLTQGDPRARDLPANTLHAPQILDFSAEGSVTQDFGRFDARLTLDGARRLRGPTTLAGLATVSNAHQSYWQGGATLRLGYELTPLLSAFVEGEASAQKFDAADPGVLRYMDGRRTELRTGLAYAHGSVLEAEASVGRGWLDYTDPALTDRQDWVYNAALTFRPDATLSLRGGLETGIGPSDDVPGDTDVTYALTGSAQYAVNPWLTLRGSAGWDRTVVLGTGGESWGYDLGAGLDLRTSRHTVWTADYAYGRDHAPPVPENDTHTVTVGVRITR